MPVKISVKYIGFYLDRYFNLGYNVIGILNSR